MSENCADTQNKAYDELSKYCETTNSLHDIDNFIVTNFNIKECFYANDLYLDPIIKYEDLANTTKRNKQYNIESKYFIYSNNSILLIFPTVGSMIHCTLQFGENIVVVKNILSNKFDDKVFDLYYTIPSEQNNTCTRRGAKIIISYSPLDMFTHIKNNKTLLEMLQHALY